MKAMILNSMLFLGMLAVVTPAARASDQLAKDFTYQIRVAGIEYAQLSDDNAKFLPDIKVIDRLDVNLVGKDKIDIGISDQFKNLRIRKDTVLPVVGAWHDVPATAFQTERGVDLYLYAALNGATSHGHGLQIDLRNLNGSRSQAITNMYYNQDDLDANVYPVVREIGRNYPASVNLILLVRRTPVKSAPQFQIGQKVISSGSLRTISEIGRDGFLKLNGWTSPFEAAPYVHAEKVGDISIGDQVIRTDWDYDLRWQDFDKAGDLSSTGFLETESTIKEEKGYTYYYPIAKWKRFESVEKYGSLNVGDSFFVRAEPSQYRRKASDACTMKVLKIDKSGQIVAIVTEEASKSGKHDLPFWCQKGEKGVVPYTMINR